MAFRRTLCRQLRTVTARIAAKEPFQVKLSEGKTYFWCRCGRSKKQPFCDGSHKGSGLQPVKFTVEGEQASQQPIFLCGCKQTGSQPFCDGTHASPLVQEAAAAAAGE